MKQILLLITVFITASCNNLIEMDIDDYNREVGLSLGRDKLRSSKYIGKTKDKIYFERTDIGFFSPNESVRFIRRENFTQNYNYYLKLPKSKPIKYDPNKKYIEEKVLEEMIRKEEKLEH